jgi:hypothetical protein
MDPVLSSTALSLAQGTMGLILEITALVLLLASMVMVPESTAPTQVQAILRPVLVSMTLALAPVVMDLVPASMAPVLALENIAARQLAQVLMAPMAVQQEPAATTRLDRALAVKMKVLMATTPANWAPV